MGSQEGGYNTETQFEEQKLNNSVITFWPFAINQNVLTVAVSVPLRLTDNKFVFEQRDCEVRVCGKWGEEQEMPAQTFDFTNTLIMNAVFGWQVKFQVWHRFQKPEITVTFLLSDGWNFKQQPDFTCLKLQQHCGFHWCNWSCCAAVICLKCKV